MKRISALLACTLAASALNAEVLLYPEGTVGTSGDAWSPTNPGIAGWLYGDIRANGTIAISREYDRTSAEAAISSPESSGSIEFTLTSGSDKAGINKYFGSELLHDTFPLGDLDGAGYDWYRNSLSTNPTAQAPALFFWIDRDGNLETSDTVGIKYEPVYNGFGGVMPEDSWQTSSIGSATNLWSWNDPTDAWKFNVTLSDWQSKYPSAVVTGMGIDVGSGWNGIFSGAVDFVIIDRSGSENDHFYDFQEAGKVSFGNCEIDIPDVVIYDGLKISELIQQCFDQAKNHGAFVKCVAELATNLQKDGHITGKQKGELISCAAKTKDL